MRKDEDRADHTWSRVEGTVPPHVLQALLDLDVQEGEYKVVPDRSELGRTVMPLAGIVEGELRLLGTSFAIGKTGFLLTAKHVLEDALGPVDAVQEPAEGLWVLYERDDMEPTLSGWLVADALPVTKVCPHPTSDLAVLQARLRRNGAGHYGFSPLRVDLGLPKAGQECLAVGFPRMAIQRRPDGRYQYQRPLHGSRGRVAEVFVDGRGAWIPFPCFETNAGADAGMSGGPMWLGDARLVGVVSRSFSPETRSSHATLTFPIAEITVPMNQGGIRENVTVKDLGDAGTVLLSG